MIVLQSVVADAETVTITFAQPDTDVRLLSGRPTVMTRQLTMVREGTSFSEELEDLLTQLSDLVDDVLTAFEVSPTLADAQADAADADDDDDDDEDMGS